MSRISSGIKNLDDLVESLHIGDNIVWEVDAGASYEVFVRNFIRESFDNRQKVIYVSFNRSPQTILNEISAFPGFEHFTLVDCFTSGKGRNDSAFLKFYDSVREVNAVRIADPKSIEEFTRSLTAIEDSLPPGARYVFDSLTGMQDLWEDEDHTYRFFTYMCPRLFDLDTVAYWILEKDAHSQKFKANLRHITQVVFDVYKRRDSLYIKALKLAGRQDREAFKPHRYDVSNGNVTITFPKKELSAGIGNRLRELRTKLGLSQKELADKVDLTPSFVSQLESGQISPSLNSFLQICGVLGINPGDFFGERTSDTLSWLFRKDEVLSRRSFTEGGVKVYSVIDSEKLSVGVAVFEPGTSLNKHFHLQKTPEFMCVMKGELSVDIDGAEHRLSFGDSVYLTKSFPSRWKNEGGDEAFLLVVW